MGSSTIINEPCIEFLMDFRAGDCVNDAQCDSYNPSICQGGLNTLPIKSS